MRDQINTIWEQLDLAKNAQEEFTWNENAIKCSEVRAGLIKLGDLLDKQQNDIMKLIEGELK